MKKALYFIFIFILCGITFSGKADNDLEITSSAYFEYSELADGTIQIDHYIGPDNKEKIIIPQIIDEKTVSAIGDYAFADKTTLPGQLIISDQITYIGNGAFSNCSGFSGSLVIPYSVVSIGEYAFYNCSGFTGGLVLQNGIKSIGDNAFYNCSGFSGPLIVPNSVKSIGINSFTHCDNFIGRIGVLDTASDGTSHVVDKIALYCSQNSYAWSWASNSRFFSPAFSSSTASAGSNANSLYTYTILSNDTIRIDRYIRISDAANIEIPDHIGDMPVTVIGDYAFDSQNHISGTITIPDTITLANKSRQID